MPSIYFFVSLLISVLLADMVKVKEWTAGQAHSDQINAVAIYNDNSKFVTGSKDYYVKIWSMETYQLLGMKLCTEVVTHISLHPVDNRIFVLVWDGAMMILDPNNYTVLYTTTYHTGYGANYLQFFSSNTKFIAGGYDSAADNPAFHIYNATTLAWIRRAAETTHGIDEQITVISVSKDLDYVASISSATAAPITLQIYNLNTDGRVKVLSDNTALLKWVLFSPFKDELYANSNDMSVQIYRKNPFNSLFGSYLTISTYDYGYPNGISAKLQNQLVYSANSNIVFLNLSSTYPQVIFARKDQADVFAFEISNDGKSLVTGMRNGQVSIWRIGQPETTKDENLILLIALGSTIGGLILLIITAVLIYKCCCKTATITNLDNKQIQLTEQQKKAKQNRTQNSIIMNQNVPLDASIGFHQ